MPFDTQPSLPLSITPPLQTQQQQQDAAHTVTSLPDHQGFPPHSHHHTPPRRRHIIQGISSHNNLVRRGREAWIPLKTQPLRQDYTKGGLCTFTSTSCQGAARAECRD